MNKEYIEREATIREFETDNSVFRYGAEDCSAIISRLKTIPKVDVAPVVHGRWTEKQNPWGQDGSHTYVCSICNERISILGTIPNYCPKCGAKMDKDDWLNTKMTESIEV